MYVSEPRVDTVTGVPSDFVVVPRWVLIRHGLRILDPATAVVAPNRPQPRATLYSASALRLPDEVAGSDALRSAIETAMGEIDLRLATTSGADVFGAAAGLARPMQLLAREQSRPAVVDAWAALQHLHAAAAGTRLAPVVEGIRLEYAYVSGFDPTGGPYEGSNPSDGTLSRLPAFGVPPVPVQVPMTRPPERRPVSERLPRRPVIALLDTGIREHPWLDWPPDKYRDRANDWFVQDVPDLQKDIADEGRRNPAAGLPILGVEDERVTMRPSVGAMETHLGHGTFAAGAIRSAAPDVTVLMIRVMHSTGIAHDRDVTCALRGLRDRVRAAQEGPDPAMMVDAVLMPFGCFEETDQLDPQTSELAQLVRELDSLGVAVVASAGNCATDRPFFPAALAGTSQPGDGPGIASVGALNPDGSLALFSNFGRWVRYWRDGVAMVSTYPIDVHGPSQSPIELPGLEAGAGLPPRRALDPDDYSSGFAVWHGTSFAAPVLAAELCNALIAQGEHDERYRLDRVDAAATRARARAAVATLQVVNADVRR